MKPKWTHGNLNIKGGEKKKHSLKTKSVMYKNKSNKRFNTHTHIYKPSKM